MSENNIKRGNTAIKRSAFSKPYQYLLKNDLLEGKILDYGCGLGYDVEESRKNGLNIAGYDKFIEKFDIISLLEEKYDMVTCNYVLNVVENPEERKNIVELLRSLGKKVYISVRNDKKSIKETWKKYNDGYLTTTGTFQKIYDEKSLKEEFGNEIIIINKSNSGLLFTF